MMKNAGKSCVNSIQPHQRLLKQGGIKMKHYSFVFYNNNGVIVATMTMATPREINVFELGDDLSMSLIHQLKINVTYQVTVDNID